MRGDRVKASAVAILPADVSGLVRDECDGTWLTLNGSCSRLKYF